MNWWAFLPLVTGQIDWDWIDSQFPAGTFLETTQDTTNGFSNWDKGFDWLAPLEPQFKNIKPIIPSTTPATTTTTTTTKPQIIPRFGRNYKCPLNCQCDNQTIAITCSKITNRFNYKAVSNQVVTLVLKDLDLSKSRLNHIALGTLSDLKNLTLTGGKLGSINARIFKFTPNLDYYTVTNTSLSGLSRFPHSAKYVDFSHNQITNLYYKWFRDLKQAYFLNLSHNQMSTISDRLRWGFASKLINLDLSYNLFKYIPKYLEELQSLKILNLQHNQLVSPYPGLVFSKFKVLEELYLDYNNIKYVESRIFLQNPKLKIFTLTNNLIKSIDSLIRYITTNKYNQLQVIDHQSYNESDFEKPEDYNYLYDDPIIEAEETRHYFLDCNDCKNLFNFKLLEQNGVEHTSAVENCQIQLDSVKFVFDEATGENSCDFIASFTTSTEMTTTTPAMFVPTIPPDLIFTTTVKNNDATTTVGQATTNLDQIQEEEIPVKNQEGKKEENEARQESELDAATDIAENNQNQRGSGFTNLAVDETYENFLEKVQEFESTSTMQPKTTPEPVTSKATTTTPTTTTATRTTATTTSPTSTEQPRIFKQCDETYFPDPTFTYYSESYEKYHCTWGRQFITTEDQFCGAHAVKIPTYKRSKFNILQENALHQQGIYAINPDLCKPEKIQGFRPQNFMHLCLAYKGDFLSIVTPDKPRYPGSFMFVDYSYINRVGKKTYLRNVHQWLEKIEIDPETMDTWKFMCINLLNNFYETMEWQNRVKNSPFVYKNGAKDHKIEEIYFKTDPENVNGSVWLDNVSISSSRPEFYLTTTVKPATTTTISTTTQSSSVTTTSNPSPSPFPSPTPSTTQLSTTQKSTTPERPTFPPLPTTTTKQIYRNIPCYLDDKYRENMHKDVELTTWCIRKCHQYNPDFRITIYFGFCFCALPNIQPDENRCQPICYVNHPEAKVCPKERYQEILLREMAKTTTPPPTTTRRHVPWKPPNFDPDQFEIFNPFNPAKENNRINFEKDADDFWIKIVTTTTTTTTTERTTTTPRTTTRRPQTTSRELFMPKLPPTTSPPPRTPPPTLFPQTTTKYRPPAMEGINQIEINRDPDKTKNTTILDTILSNKEFLAIAAVVVFIFGFSLAIGLITYAKNRTAENRRRNEERRRNEREERRRQRRERRAQNQEDTSSGGGSGSGGGQGSGGQRARNVNDRPVMPASLVENPPGYGEVYPEYAEPQLNVPQGLPGIYNPVLTNTLEEQLPTYETFNTNLPRSNNVSPEPSAPAFEILEDLPEYSANQQERRNGHQL